MVLSYRSRHAIRPVHIYVYSCLNIYEEFTLYVSPYGKRVVINYGGLQNGRGGGQLKFYPYKMGGGGVLAILKGGGGQQALG